MLARADAALTRAPYTVVDKTQTARQRRPARLYEHGPLLVARPLEAERPALYAARRPYEPRARHQRLRPDRSGGDDRRRPGPVAGVLLHRRRALRGQGRRIPSSLVPGARNEDEPEPQPRPGRAGSGVGPGRGGDRRLPDGACGRGAGAAGYVVQPDRRRAGGAARLVRRPGPLDGDQRDRPRREGGDQQPRRLLRQADQRVRPVRRDGRCGRRR
jgi:hypothetical protein